MHERRGHMTLFVCLINRISSSPPYIGNLFFANLPVSSNYTLPISLSF